MPVASVALAEPFVQAAFPRDDRCDGKVLTLLCILIGVGFAIFLGLVPYGGLHLAIEDSAIALAAELRQLARAHEAMPTVMQRLRASLARQSLRMHPAKALAWQHKNPVMSSSCQSVYAIRQGSGYNAANENRGGYVTDRGKLLRWNSERGYGFILPSDGSDELFCHVSSLVDGEEKVQRGDYVTYTKEYSDRTGKYEALEVRLDRTKERPLLGQEFRGVVLRWNTGFGFIRPDDGSEDIFVHSSNIAYGDILDARDKVRFTKEFDDRKGRHEAVCVRVIEKGTGELPLQWSGGDFVEANGQLVRWNHERGFGFIKPNDGDDMLFAHISDLEDGDGSVQEGNMVTYIKDFVESKQKHQAFKIRYAGEGPNLYEASEWSPEGGERGESSEIVTEENIQMG